MPTSMVGVPPVRAFNGLAEGRTYQRLRIERTPSMIQIDVIRGVQSAELASP